MHSDTTIGHSHRAQSSGTVPDTCSRLPTRLWPSEASSLHPMMIKLLYKHGNCVSLRFRPQGLCPNWLPKFVELSHNNQYSQSLKQDSDPSRHFDWTPTQPSANSSGTVVGHCARHLFPTPDTCLALRSFKPSFDDERTAA